MLYDQRPTASLNYSTLVEFGNSPAICARLEEDAVSTAGKRVLVEFKLSE